MPESIISRDVQLLLVRRIRDQLARELGREPDPLISVALRSAITSPNSIRIEHLAQSSKLSQRSLRRYCLRAGLPTPSRLIGWARLCVAASLSPYTQPSSIVAASSIARVPSSAFRQLLRRYTGIAPSQVEVRRMEKEIIRAFAGELSRHLQFAEPFTARSSTRSVSLSDSRSQMDSEVDSTQH